MKLVRHTPDTAGREPDWRTLADCIGRADEMFPENDESKIANAKTICKPCPVARECFWDAVRTGDNQHGIRAGLRANERRGVVKELRRRQAEAGQPEPPEVLAPKPIRQPAQCGTTAGYRKHVREKTPKCEPCRRAHTEADRRLRQTGTSKVIA